MRSMGRGMVTDMAQDEPQLPMRNFGAATQGAGELGTWMRQHATKPPQQTPFDIAASPSYLSALSPSSNHSVAVELEDMKGLEATAHPENSRLHLLMRSMGRAVSIHRVDEDVKHLLSDGGTASK